MEVETICQLKGNSAGEFGKHCLSQPLAKRAPYPQPRKDFLPLVLLQILSTLVVAGKTLSVTGTPAVLQSLFHIIMVAERVSKKSKEAKAQALGFGAWWFNVELFCETPRKIYNGRRTITMNSR